MKFITLSVFILAMGCSSFQKKEKEITVKEAAGCTVMEAEGNGVLSCPDGTTAIIKDGIDGEQGAPGAAGKPGNSGSPGPAGSGTQCTIDEEQSTFSCDDGTSVLLSGCTIVEVEYGADLTCGNVTIPIRHGRNGQPGQGMGQGHRRSCTAQYNYDRYWYWDLEFIVTSYSDWSVFELVEVGHQRNSNVTRTRQGSVMTQDLKVVSSENFGATLSGDNVEFFKLETENKLKCSLAGSK